MNKYVQIYIKELQEKTAAALMPGSGFDNVLPSAPLYTPTPTPAPTVNQVAPFKMTLDGKQPTLLPQAPTVASLGDKSPPIKMTLNGAQPAQPVQEDKPKDWNAIFKSQTGSDFQATSKQDRYNMERIKATGGGTVSTKQYRRLAKNLR